MLNQLIESKNHNAENARKNGFLLTTLGVLVAVLLSGWTYSLFAKNFGMGTGDFELSSIVAPVIANEEPLPPEPEQKQPERQQTASSNEKPTVIEKVPRIEDSLSKEPPKLDESRKLNSSPLTLDEMRDYSEGPENKYRATPDQSGPGTVGIKQPATAKTDDEEDDKTPVVVVKPTPAPTVKNASVTKTGGVLNGKASFLAKPPYPAAAKAMGVTGAVNVQVLIDEKGNVVSAAAASGHPLLRSVSEIAARQSKFTPTFLSNQPVRVTGVIVYQFKP
jgi:periplasmic protein TonB